MGRIDRNYYLKQLIEKRENRRVKVVTGIRRCGKSVTLGSGQFVTFPYLVTELTAVPFQHLLLLFPPDFVDASPKTPHKFL